MSTIAANCGAAVKRGADMFFSAAALVMFSPVLLIVALLVRMQLGRPVLFRQRRPGRDERPFELVKFRTMRDSVGGDGELLPDGKRLTPLGQWLRSMSLDELPQLVNVFRGEMSIVGPRPLLMEYLEYYTPRQRVRHAVRPGITGWAQVNGRNAISWDEKLEMDAWYVENRSLALDAKIVMLTVLKVLRRSGISHVGEATMPKFTGTSQ